MAQKAGHPKKKIETGEMHPAPPLGDPSDCEMSSFYGRKVVAKTIKMV